MAASFWFSRGTTLAFKDNEELEEPTWMYPLGRETLIFTGATAATSNVVTSAFVAGKFGVRALSQSFAKGFGKENILYM